MGSHKEGLIPLAVEKPDLVDTEIQRNKPLLSEMFQKSIPDDMRKVALGVYVDFSEIKPVYDRVDKVPLFRMFIEEARELLSQEIELDRISESDFYSIVLSRSTLSEKVRKYIARF
jgi:hypothetical protein